MAENYVQLQGLLSTDMQMRQHMTKSLNNFSITNEQIITTLADMMESVLINNDEKTDKINHLQRQLQEQIASTYDDIMDDSLGDETKQIQDLKRQHNLEINALKQTISTLNTKIEKRREQKENHQKRLSALKDVISETNSRHIESNRKHAESTKELEERLERAYKTSVTIHKLYTELQTSTKVDLGVSHGEYIKLVGMIEQRDLLIEKNSKELEQLNEQLSQRATTKAEYLKDIYSLNQEIITLKDRFIFGKPAAESSITTEKNKLILKISENATLKNTIKHLEAQIKDQRSQLNMNVESFKKRKAEIARLGKQITELKNMKQNDGVNEKHRKEIATLQVKNRGLEENLAKSNDQCRKLQVKLTTNDKNLYFPDEFVGCCKTRKCDEVTMLESKYDELEKQLADSKIEVQNAKRELLMHQICSTNEEVKPFYSRI